jgi:predicted GNAT family acetyltransferase
MVELYLPSFLNLYYDFFGVSMKKMMFINISYSLALLFTLARQSNATNSLSIPTCADSAQEESGWCTIVAQQNTTKTLSPQPAIISTYCTLGRIELSWIINQKKDPRATITHLEINSEMRGQGIGKSLFQAGITFLMSYLDYPQITWKAQPLDRGITLANLIQFYEKQGGYVTKLFEETSIACMALRTDTFTPLDCDLKNSTLPENLCLLHFKDFRPDCQLKVKDFNIVKQSFNEFEKTTIIITPAGATHSTRATSKNASSPKRG